MATIPTDDRFGDQWHLKNNAVGEYDLDVVDVWDDYTGKGVTVFVLDSGVDYTNPDLAKINLTLSHDYFSNDTDPAPVGASDNHGTAVAGIIGASANDGGVVGVAYGSELVHYRLGATSVPYTSSYPALGDAVANGADVINMSWGTGYNFDINTTDSADQLDRFRNAVDAGRDGLGTILVKSAGNSRGDGFLTNTNGQITGNDTHTILTAAVNRDGTVTTYSTPGSSLLISGFGSPLSGQVVTTDRVGASGYSSGNIATNFNGTSAAAPMVSGVAALMLDANDSLGWRDVQTIMALSARHVGSDVGATSLSGSELDLWEFNGADNWNGGGMHFSSDYGYGLIDALGAVRLAETWGKSSTSANEAKLSKVLLNASEVIPDGDLAGKVYATKFDKSMDVERVQVKLTFTAENPQDLEIYVTGPDGKKHLVAGDIPQGDYGSILTPYEFTFTTQEFRGESGNGKWRVQIVDDQSTSATTVSSVELQVFGAAASKNDTYYYTNEFSDYSDTHSANLKDTNGGRDLLNAAAVTAAMTVDLGKGTGNIDGVAMKIKGVENVYAGDGDDTLTGTNAANSLAGGRGADLLTGGKGSDDFIYRLVRDSRSVESHDLIKDFGKGDDIVLTRIDAVQDELDINDKFSFIKGAAFGEVAGQLRFELVDAAGKKNDFTFVTADIDGDATADLMIALSGLHKLKATDFML